MAKFLLSVAELREEYNLGRDLASRLIKLLPNVRIGRFGRGERLLVRRDHVDQLLAHVIRNRQNLWEIARNSTPEMLEAWLHESPGSDL